MAPAPDRGLAIGRPQTPSLKPFGLPANLQADLIGRRPDVVASRLRAEAAAQRIDVARGDFYPNVGLSGGTGSVFALIPAQNATGNWIKVVQRLPVRIALDRSDLLQHPLRVGLSMEATIDTARRWSAPR